MTTATRFVAESLLGRSLLRWLPTKMTGTGRFWIAKRECGGAVPHRVRAVGDDDAVRALLDLLRHPLRHALPVVRVDVLAEDAVEDVRLDLGDVGELWDDAE